MISGVTRVLSLIGLLFSEAEKNWSSLMTAEDILKPSPEIQWQLDRSNSPLASYAKSLRSLLEQERHANLAAG